jgi:hypothetical protein
MHVTNYEKYNVQSVSNSCHRKHVLISFDQYVRSQTMYVEYKFENNLLTENGLPDCMMCSVTVRMNVSNCLKQYY